MTRLIIDNNNYILAEGFDTIASYTDKKIVLCKGQMSVEFEGEKLLIKGVSVEAVSISGCFFQIKWYQKGAKHES